MYTVCNSHAEMRYRSSSAVFYSLRCVHGVYGHNDMPKPCNVYFFCFTSPSPMVRFVFFFLLDRRRPVSDVYCSHIVHPSQMYTIFRDHKRWIGRYCGCNTIEYVGTVLRSSPNGSVVPVSQDCEVRFGFKTFEVLYHSFRHGIVRYE